MRRTLGIKFWLLLRTFFNKRATQPNFTFTHFSIFTTQKNSWRNDQLIIFSRTCSALVYFFQFN